MSDHSCCSSKSTTSQSTTEAEAPEPVDTHSSCCGSANGQAKTEEDAESCCASPKHRVDWLLWGSISIVILGYGVSLISPVDHSVSDHASIAWWAIASDSIFELINTMWLSVVFAVIFVGVLSQVPQALVVALLGRGGTFSGLLRATAAGVLMDLCSHGILMVGMKLYQKGASLGQTMAFLVASPWNSISLTIILFALIGWQWTLAFIALSMVLAVITGWVFDRLVAAKQLPVHGQAVATAADEQGGNAWQIAKNSWRATQWNSDLVKTIGRESLSGSRIVLRWLLFGVVLASLIRALVPPDVFQQWLGPSVLGLMVTLVAATIIEVCSEGSAPIAADIMNRTSAPGNGFAFLMTGVATDYTEVMVIKDTMSSWKVALFLPLITVPQVIVVALILNGLA